VSNAPEEARHEPWEQAAAGEGQRWFQVSTLLPERWSSVLLTAFADAGTVALE